MITASWVERNFFPPPSPNPDPHKLRERIDDFLLYQHEIRARDVRMDRKGELYDAGVQWLYRAQAGGDVGGMSTQWVPIYWDANDPNYLPTPVFNEGFRPRQNESARLARPEYKPSVVPRGDPNDFTAKIGAKTMERSTKYCLARMEWDKQEELLYYHMPVYGGAWLKSEWVMTYDKVAPSPSPVAVACPGCSMKLASPLLSKEQVGILAGSVGGPPPIPQLDEGMGGGAFDRMVGKMRSMAGLSTGMMQETKSEVGIGRTPFVFAENSIIPVGGSDQGISRATSCPFCNDHHELQPFKPTLEEAGTLLDSVGRPMGKMVPIGDWELSVRPPYDVFPKDLGLNMRQGYVNEWVEAHVETMEWIALRWPNKVNEVEPERPERLTEYHPVAGAPDLYAGAYAGKLFKNATRVKEYHRQPSMYPYVVDGQVQWRFDKGRSIVMAGDVVLMDAEMMLPSSNKPGEFVERVILDYIPWEIRDGGRRLKGLSLWELMFDPQDTVNLGKSQTQAVQERLAVPFYIASRQHNIQGVTKRAGLPGLFVEMDIDPLSNTFIPTLMNNETINPGVGQAIAAAYDFMMRAGGLTEVEQGHTPPNVSAAYAIQQLKLASGEGRAPRIRRIKNGLKKAWGHGARLQDAFYSPLERREIRYHDDATDEDVWSTVSALDFNGQTDVEIEGEPDLDEEAEIGERIRDAVQLQVLNPQQSPQMQRNVARLMKLPKELYEDELMQEAAAQREFLAFRDNGKVPVPDPSLDDNDMHYRVHGQSAHSPWFRQLEVAGNWDEVLLILGADWDQTLLALLTAPPFDAQVINDYINQTMQAQILGLPPPPPPVPETLQVRILKTWQQKLEMAQFMPPQPDILNRVMNWRAHMEAHKLINQKRMMVSAGMMSGPPPIAAPGAPAGASGAEPGPGVPAEQGAQPEPMPA